MRSDVPQTIAEARRFEWCWLRCKCRMCHRHTELHFLDVKGDELKMPLARYARRIYCRRCGPDRGRNLDFQLGARERSGQNCAYYKAIEFCGDRTIAPGR